jgi:hypothetical protein
MPSYLFGEITRLGNTLLAIASSHSRAESPSVAIAFAWASPLGEYPQAEDRERAHSSPCFLLLPERVALLFFIPTDIACINHAYASIQSRSGVEFQSVVLHAPPPDQQA